MHRTALLGAAFASLLGAAGCVIPYAVPPMRMDLAGAHRITGEDRNAFHFTAGVHAASLGPRAISRADTFDVGVGYVVDKDAHGLRDQGLYGEASWFFFRREHVRMSAGARGEMLFSGDRTGTGLYARVSSEVFTVGSGSGVSDDDRCSSNAMAWYGVPGTALYAEAGAQHLPDGREAAVVTAGLSLRLPAVAGLLMIVPGCK